MKRIFLCALFLLPSLSQAYTHPQYFFQADDSESVLTPRLTFFGRNVKTEFGKSDITLVDAAVEFEYGLLDMLSLGANWGYQQVDVESGNNNYDYSGMRDLNIFVKSFYQVDAFRFRYGAEFGFGSIAEEDANGRPSNAYSGRYDLTPYVGFDYQMGLSIFGAKISTEIPFGERKTELASGGERRETGGNTTSLGVFYEYHKPDDFLLGASLEYRTTTDYEDQNGNTAEFIDTVGLDIYSAFQVNDGFDLIPQITYQTITENQSNGVNIDTWNEYAVQVDARFTF